MFSNIGLWKLFADKEVWEIGEWWREN